MILFFKRKIKFVIVVLIYIGTANTTFAQSVSVSFTKGFFGRVGNNAQKADNIINLTTLQITKVSFVQSDSDGDGKFTLQGNDLPGTIVLYCSSGVTHSLTGSLNWRITATGSIEVFGFVFNSGQSATINYGSGSTYSVSGGTTNGTSSNLGLLSYASTYSIKADGQNDAGNAASIAQTLTDLNTEFATSPLTLRPPVLGAITHPTCLLSTGSIAMSGLPGGGSNWTVTASPGGATYSSSGTTGTFTGLAAGTYTFTVTNAEGSTSGSCGDTTINAQSVLVVQRLSVQVEVLY